MAERGPGKARSRGASKEASRQERPVCSVAFCPIGLTLTGVQAAGTDALEHLLAAAREFLLAAKSVMDARAADVDPSGRSGDLERIEIA
jgi:hypothetical protein